MLFNTVEQAVSCGRITDDIKATNARRLNWVRHAEDLQRKIEDEERQIENLRQQIERTGDRESFIGFIRNSEQEIRNLRRQIAVAEDKARDEEDTLNDLLRDWQANECDGSVPS